MIEESLKCLIKIKFDKKKKILLYKNHDSFDLNVILFNEKKKCKIYF